MTRGFLDAPSGHLTPDAWLERQLTDEVLRDPANTIAGRLAGGRTRHGWSIYAPEDPVGEWPEDLLRLIRKARHCDAA